MGVIALDAAGPRVPDLDRAILGAGDHPFPLAMEGHSGNVPGMAVEGEHRAWISGANVVEFDVVVSRCSEITLIGRNAETIDLRVGMLDCARADAGKSFPEPYGMVIPRYFIE